MSAWHGQYLKTDQGADDVLPCWQDPYQRILSIAEVTTTAKPPLCCSLYSQATLHCDMLPGMRGMLGHVVQVCNKVGNPRRSTLVERTTPTFRGPGRGVVVAADEEVAADQVPLRALAAPAAADAVDAVVAHRRLVLLRRVARPLLLQSTRQRECRNVAGVRPILDHVMQSYLQYSCHITA